MFWLKGDGSMQVIHGRGYVYAIQYNIVWCTKYRRKVLATSVASALINVLKEYASENNFTIEESECMEDHIHLLIQAPP